MKTFSILIVVAVVLFVATAIAFEAFKVMNVITAQHTFANQVMQDAILK